MVADWRPATDTEIALSTAAESGDRTAFLAALAAGPLLLPISPAAAAGQEPVRWATAAQDETTFLLAFTSAEAISACLPGQHVPYRVTNLADLVAAWPDPAWWLVVDPGLPIGTRLPLDLLRQAPKPEPIPGESELLTAIQQQNENAFVAALLRCELAIPLDPGGSTSRDVTDPDFPWVLLPDPTGGTRVMAFTSEARLRRTLGDHDAVFVSSVHLAENWPDQSWVLALNPGTPVATDLPGNAFRRLGDWVGELRTVMTEEFERERERLVAGESEPAIPRQVDRGGGEAATGVEAEADDARDQVPLRLQLVIPHAYVNAYLEQGYDRAAGLVHVWRGPGRDAPPGLYRRLGLLGEGSPFAETDESVVVLRWSPEDETPPEWADSEPRMESVVVPDGAELYRLHRDRREEPLARFDITVRRWHPAG